MKDLGTFDVRCLGLGKSIFPLGYFSFCACNQGVKKGKLYVNIAVRQRL